MDHQSFILYFATYPPRECGIATFTKDLTTAMDKRFNPTLKSRILAVNDNGSSIYNYNKKVIMQLNETDVEGYMELANKINNTKKIKLVCIQHEFGIFGGIDNGEFLIPFMEKLEKPIVATFHSIFPSPDEQRLKIVRAICKRAKAIVVMAETGKKILEEKYGIETKKIYVINHGVPSIKFNKKKDLEIKKLLNLEGKTVLSTFGLINRGKGIEHVIKALPTLIKKYPNLIYLVIGETHPNVRKVEGESYRNYLTKLVEKYNLKDHVKFYNKYLTLQEIVNYLRATDIYIYAAQDPYQIVSGTLAYAFGAGKAIIATPSLYAQELLKNGKGILVEFNDYVKIRKVIDKILSDSKLKSRLETGAYSFSREMTWPNVASKYLEVFKNIIKVNEDIGMKKFPRVKLAHLATLTDYTGVIQHSKHSMPIRDSGYTLDDNSRALMVTTKYYEKYKDKESLKLISTYLSFIHYMQRKDSFFHNLLSFRKEFLDEKGSEDSFGRALGATGYVVSSSVNDNLKSAAKFIFDNAVKHIHKLKSIRAMAFSIAGMYSYYKVHKHKDILDKVTFLADKILKNYEHNSGEDWKWFEETITYSNGNIPEALFLAYDLTKDKRYLDVAEESLNFLSSLLIIDGKLVLIGRKGWYNRGGRRAFYDQQPVDASSMVQAYITAYEITGKRKYYEHALLAYNWFLGKNSINQTVYDETTGGCYDGLLSNCLNLNQGAESTICHLLARLCFLKKF